MVGRMKITFAVALTLLAVAGTNPAHAEICTTQSQMKPSERDALAAAARTLAEKVQANDANGIKTLTVSEYASDFGGIANAVSNASLRTKGATPTVEQVYLLDGTMLKKQADGSMVDAQFFCSLNRTAQETDFVIPNLPPGKYGFALVNLPGAPTPYRLSFLVRQDAGQWLLAGFYPQPQSAAGHDGLWYWKAARDLAAQKQPWSAWLYYQTATELLRPAGFVQSSHLEALRTEQVKNAPPALADGISSDTPLVVKGPDNVEYRFTALDTDDSLAKDHVDVAAHIKADAIADPALARKRNIAAMTALLTVYPELRKSFHGIWIFADSGSQNPFATEQAMTEIP